MHCEKNLVENLLKMIVGDKDTVKVRRDLQSKDIRKHLWLTPDSRRQTRMLKPCAPYVLSASEFDVFCTTLESIKPPSQFVSGLGDKIRRKKFSGLKSHDYHILMQMYLPLALRGLLQEGPRQAVMRISRVFRRLCCKIWNPTEINSLREDVAVTMCLLEIHFPPALFDIMTHLPLHLVEQLYLCGPVTVRWMYPVERYMKTLKEYVRNMARPEGSIAQGYILDECVGFITKYLQRFEPVRRRVWDAEEEEGDSGEKLEGTATVFQMTPSLRDMAHEYVLQNSTLMTNWRRMWQSLADQNSASIEPFAEWIQSAVHASEVDAECDDDLDWIMLCMKPSLTARSYKKMRAYGCHYRVEDSRAASLETYDCGVACVSDEPDESGRIQIGYVGILKDIVELDYGRVYTPIILFNCEWKKRTDNRGNHTYIQDQDGFLTVNFRHKLPKTHQPFLFPSQCISVFFSNDRRPGWKVILKNNPRSQRMKEDAHNDDMFISTNAEAEALHPPLQFAPLPVTPCLDGAMLLSGTDNLRAFASY